MKRALTIAGSDSGGGAGIQADIKTFSARGVYGMSVITAVTAQNTLGVTAIHAIPVEIVAAQFDAVLGDIGADAAKTGMLATPELVELVAAKITEYRIEKLVVDPVMVAKGGDRLLSEDAISTLKAKLIPLAYCLTPNRPEAEALCGFSIQTLDDSERAAQQICGMGAQSCVIKGGHGEHGADDLLYDGREVVVFKAERFQTKNTHGTGCTFSAAICAELARGRNLREAVSIAKAYVTEAIRHEPGLGHGHGPLNHLWELRRTED